MEEYRNLIGYRMIIDIFSHFDTKQPEQHLDAFLTEVPVSWSGSPRIVLYSRGEKQPIRSGVIDAEIRLQQTYTTTVENIRRMWRTTTR